ncbi:hypothetical protein CERZMDRAFT_83514 [Cercospora zeae-maydis SCOH1-5]|uniref:Uncharacterized protein n=1 Tax=Cercospora zeae-maydis SCOH1-5 TaxID=717836 RepID=A0A6A6FL12_9PEZI|nr:hypothetical protein CERZMDRAFT_83514 [Cercospora zeae-maydis SCOH1-5]
MAANRQPPTVGKTSTRGRVKLPDNRESRPQSHAWRKPSLSFPRGKKKKRQLHHPFLSSLIRLHTQNLHEKEERLAKKIKAPHWASSPTSNECSQTHTHTHTHALLSRTHSVHSILQHKTSQKQHHSTPTSSSTLTDDDDNGAIQYNTIHITQPHPVSAQRTMGNAQ